MVRANAERLRSTGFTAEQVVGKDVIELFPDLRDVALALHARARAGHRVEVPRHARTVNGRGTWFEGSIEPVAMEAATGLLITAREVAPAAGAHAEVQEPAGTLEILIETMPIGVVVTDARGEFTLANQEANRIFNGAVKWTAEGPVRRYTLHRLGGEPFPTQELPLVRALRAGAVTKASSSSSVTTVVRSWRSWPRPRARREAL